tara:strand:+ start:3088 stop:4137 length:1050 start_codon:yes stop_codon:yes gene_type:complete
MGFFDRSTPTEEELQAANSKIASQDFTPRGGYNVAKSVGQSFWDQTQYGMNDRAQEEDARLAALGGPAYYNLSPEERVQAARAPQMNEQLPNAMNPQQRQAAGLPPLPQGSPSGQGNGNGSSGSNGSGGNGGSDPISRLAEARAPRGLTFSNLFGSTGYNPETGQFDQTDSDEYAQFQQGLLGQLQSSQEAYQNFNPQDAASEYLRGVNAIREPLRAGQTQSALSRLVQSGKLGATAGTQALAQLESEQENQRFQEGVQATQYGTQMQDRMLQNQAGLFGLAGNVAQQQFAGQQQALGAVPLLQEINSFAEEPAFQRDLAQMSIDAQGDANDMGLFGDIFKTVSPYIFG